MEVLNYSTNYKGTFPLAMLRELAEWVAREIQEKSRYLKKRRLAQKLGASSLFPVEMLFLLIVNCGAFCCS